jgi:hypothetical protein
MMKKTKTRNHDPFADGSQDPFVDHVRFAKNAKGGDSSRSSVSQTIFPFMAAQDIQIWHLLARLP